MDEHVKDDMSAWKQFQDFLPWRNLAIFILVCALGIALIHQFAGDKTPPARAVQASTPTK